MVLILFGFKRIIIERFLNQIMIFVCTYKIIRIINRFRVALLNSAKHSIKFFQSRCVEAREDLIRLKTDFG